MSGATQDALSKDVEGTNRTRARPDRPGAVPVQVDCDDTQFFADFVEIYPDSNRIVATATSWSVTPTSRISAERLEFDTKTNTGMFYNADGMASLGDRVDRSMFGTQEAGRACSAARRSTSSGRRSTRSSTARFTTCVQPTPRWEMVSGSATINLDDYALLKNSVFRVKGVPLMYLPIFYYPIQEDDRATGFLMPIYGTSTLTRAVAQQRVLLGDHPQPGRDVHPRLVLQGGPADRRRISLHRRAAGRRATRASRTLDEKEIDADDAAETSSRAAQLSDHRRR